MTNRTVTRANWIRLSDGSTHSGSIPTPIKAQTLPLPIYLNKNIAVLTNNQCGINSERISGSDLLSFNRSIHLFNVKNGFKEKLTSNGLQRRPEQDIPVRL